MTPMDDLIALPNLGPRSREMLARAGIDSADALRRLGAVRAYAMVQATGARPSLNLLWALEGAVTGQPWQVVAREHRLSLLLALEAMAGPGAQPAGRKQLRRPGLPAAPGANDATTPRVPARRRA
jgi:DNA transformation protein